MATYDKEAVTIIEALKKWKHYLAEVELIYGPCVSPEQWHCVPVRSSVMWHRRTYPLIFVGAMSPTNIVYIHWYQ
jgi:hypothetical protein